MKPERLAEIRALSEIEVQTFNSFTEERPSSGEMQAALREVLAYVDDLGSLGVELNSVRDQVEHAIARGTEEASRKIAAEVVRLMQETASLPLPKLKRLFNSLERDYPSPARGNALDGLREIIGEIETRFPAEEGKPEQIPGGTFYSPDLDITRKAEEPKR